MSLEFIDGFLQDQGQWGLKWDASSGGSLVNNAGRFGGNSINVNSNPGIVLTSNQLSSVATRTVGFALYWQNIGSTAPFFQFMDSGTVQVDLRGTATGAIQVTRAGTVLATSTQLMPVHSWIYVEFQATISSSAGAYTVKVWSGPSPGVWLTATGVNTQNTGNASMNGLSFPSAGGNSQICDFYCLNPSGSVNNGFLGESRVLTSMPTGDDASFKQWTPSAGTNHYANVAEVPQDGDSTYNSSAAAGQIDLYTFPAIAPTGPILGVQTVLTVRKDDVGTRTVTEQCKSGGVNVQGSNSIAPASSYAMFRQIRETDPATSAAWTAGGLNAAEFGINCVA